jgi:hypothetical protein
MSGGSPAGWTMKTLYPCFFVGVKRVNPEYLTFELMPIDLVGTIPCGYLIL